MQKTPRNAEAGRLEAFGEVRRESGRDVGVLKDASEGGESGTRHSNASSFLP